MATLITLWKILSNRWVSLALVAVLGFSMGWVRGSNYEEQSNKIVNLNDKVDALTKNLAASRTLAGLNQRDAEELRAKEKAYVLRIEQARRELDTVDDRCIATDADVGRLSKPKGRRSR